MTAGAFEKLTSAVCLGLTLLFSAGWGVLICMPTGWTKKMSIFYVIDCGLLRVEIGPGVAQEIVGAVLDNISPEAGHKLRDFFRGTFDTQEFKEYMCTIVLPPPLFDPCSIWQNLHWASWSMFGCAVLATILSVSAGFMLYYWAFVKARQVMRVWIRALYGIASFLYIVGVFLYIMMTRDTNNMPPRTEGTTLGPCVMVALVLTVMSLLPILITTVTVRETLDEAKNEFASEAKKLDRELAHEQRYGATAQLQAQIDAEHQMQAAYQQQANMQQQVAPLQPQQGVYKQQQYQQSPQPIAQQGYVAGNVVTMGRAEGTVGAMGGGGGYGSTPQPGMGKPAW